MLISLFIAALFALAQAQDCPQVDLVTNFDLSSYAQGVWYEIGREHLKGTVNYVFLDGKSNYKLAMSFLAVDYTNYAIKYACQYDPATKTKNELAWIFSRTKTLTDSAKAAIDSYLASSKLLDKSKFFWDAFSDDSCKFTDSSVDRTLPKRMT